MCQQRDPMRCLIVDDSAAFRAAASIMLERAGFDVVGMAANRDEALSCNRELHPEVILVDIDLGDESGFDVVAALHRAGPPEPSLILISTHSEQDFADLIADSPALGFLPKFALSPDSIRALVASRPRGGEPSPTDHAAVDNAGREGRGVRGGEPSPTDLS